MTLPNIFDKTPGSVSGEPSDDVASDFEVDETDTGSELLEKDPQCFWCKHLGDGLRCAAFPGGIPDAILYHRHDHRQPYPGDHGVRFEPTA